MHDHPRHAGHVWLSWKQCNSLTFTHTHSNINMHAEHAWTPQIRLDIMNFPSQHEDTFTWQHFMHIIKIPSHHWVWRNLCGTNEKRESSMSYTLSHVISFHSLGYTSMHTLTDDPNQDQISPQKNREYPFKGVTLSSSHSLVRSELTHISKPRTAKTLSWHEPRDLHLFLGMNLSSTVRLAHSSIFWRIHTCVQDLCSQRNPCNLQRAEAGSEWPCWAEMKSWPWDMIRVTLLSRDKELALRYDQSDPVE